MEPDSTARAELVAALDAMEEAARANAARNKEIITRVRRLRTGIAKGEPAARVVSKATEPRSVELISLNLDTMADVGSQFRYALARALRDEGLTIQAIADLFGVTRQRISALLRQRDPGG